MNKSVIKVTLLVLLIVFIIIVILIMRNKTTKEVKDEYMNNYIEITVNTNGGVPYIWEYEIEDSSIIEYVRDYKIENNNNGKIVGAPIKINYVFEGLKEGKTKIIFKYANFTNGEIAKEVIYNIKVDENKSVSIINK